MAGRLMPGGSFCLTFWTNPLTRLGVSALFISSHHCLFDANSDDPYQTHSVAFGLLVIKPSRGGSALMDVRK